MAYALMRRKTPRSSSFTATRHRKVASPILAALKATVISGSLGPAARDRHRLGGVGLRMEWRKAAARKAPEFAVAAAPAKGGSGSGGGDGDGALTVSVRVVVPYHPTSHGQQLVLVGGCEALGNWDPKKGIHFAWCEGHSHTVEVELPIHSHISCKLVVVGCGDQATWEPGVDRELLLAPSSLASRAAGYTVLCHWGYPECSQVLANNLRRGGNGNGSGATTSTTGHRANHQRSSAQSTPADNPIIAGVKKALAHASSRVIPGASSSWDGDEGEEDSTAVLVQCQVTVLVPKTGPKLKSPDQTLVLVGSTAALGRWDPAQGLPLERCGEEEDSPMWVAHAELLLGEGLQAKVVVVDTVTGQAQVWEPCENRALAPVRGSGGGGAGGGVGSRPVMVTAYWGTPTTHCLEVDRLSSVAATSPQVVQLLRQQLAATSSQLDGLRRERDEARRAMAASEDHKRQLEGTVKSMDRSSSGGGGGGSNIVSLQGRQDMVQLAQQLQTTRKLYEVTKKEAMELGGNVGVTRQLCDAAKRELASLASQLEAAKRAYEALAPQVERMEKQLAVTSRAFDATKPELLALEAQLERARSLFDRTLQKIESAKSLTASGDLDPMSAAAVVRRMRSGSTGEATAVRGVAAREVQIAAKR